VAALMRIARSTLGRLYPSDSWRKYATLVFAFRATADRSVSSAFWNHWFNVIDPLPLNDHDTVAIANGLSSTLRIDSVMERA
jgi:hypothetical protein